jgi:hypothetical protein
MTRDDVLALVVTLVNALTRMQPDERLCRECFTVLGAGEMCYCSPAFDE